MGVPDERCGEVLNRNLTEDEKMLVMDMHNQKRMEIANGLELRGDPGPQPSAANMMELVSIRGKITNVLLLRENILFYSVYLNSHNQKIYSTQTWDKELEVMAQVWAEQCITNCMVNSCHDCPRCRKSKRFSVGQNYYNFGHFSGSWERSVQGWYDEVVDFNQSFVSPF